MTKRGGIRDRVREVLSVKDAPHKIALAFSVGIFMGISPFIGLHSLLALALAWALGLNRFVVLSGVFVTNPWSAVPIYAFCTWVGVVVIGADTSHITEGLDWGSAGFKDIYRLGDLLLPFFVGTLLVAAGSAAASYVIVRGAVKRSQRGQAR
jgi:hypothetical protein